jgi:5-methylcytosine-specific restriction endonuclease McrA
VCYTERDDQVRDAGLLFVEACTPSQVNALVDIAPVMSGSPRAGLVVGAGSRCDGGFVMTTRDPAKRIAASRRYYQAHREERCAAARAYRAAHKDRDREKKRIADREYRQSHLAEERERDRLYHLSHIEEIRASQADYRREHRDEWLTRKRTNHQRHKDSDNAKSCEYRQQNLERIKAQQREWRLAHREELLVKKREYGASHRAERLAYLNAARKTPKGREQRRVQEANRRAAKSTSEIGPIDYEAIKHRDGMKCCVCGKRVLQRDLSFDHVIPLALGGPHIQSNLRVCHKVCNSRKGIGRIPVQMVLIDE